MSQSFRRYCSSHYRYHLLHFPHHHHHHPVPVCEEGRRPLVPLGAHWVRPEDRFRHPLVGHRWAAPHFQQVTRKTSLTAEDQYFHLPARTWGHPQTSGVRKRKKAAPLVWSCVAYPLERIVLFVFAPSVEWWWLFPHRSQAR